MTESSLGNIEKLETDLWEAADNLRANSKLTSSEYCMPVLGVIFLRHAANRFESASKQIEADQASGKMPKRRVRPEDYVTRRALFLPEEARYEKILATPKEADLGEALVAAMNAIEESFEPLRGVLPKDFSIFERTVLEDLMKVFNREALKTATGDVFGRIYEYFLMKFAMQGAQDNGEFFTPPSLVQTIVNVIEPDHGIVADLACGSGGMFVQSSHFIEAHGQDTMRRVTFYGQEKTATTIKLAKMNLAVHGLEGHIAEANTFYQDEHRLPDGRPLWGHVDFCMANPPFNVDMVDAEKIKDDRRLPFGLPGVNKGKKVSNGNYLWISYFHSYLSPKGRAGFVMSSQASSAGHGEREVRRKIVQTGDVDIMVAIRSNFFYTRTVPCELWFFDKGKPSPPLPSPPAPLPKGEGSKHYRGGYDFSGLVERARELREKQTPAEDVLWQLLRNRQLAGLKFRRQHQIGDYITDFYCDEIKLVIELDGAIHGTARQSKRDEAKQRYLESLGLIILRFDNQSALDSPQTIFEAIISYLPSPNGRGVGGEGKSCAPHGPLNAKGNILMLDARNIFRKVTRKIYDFSPEQLKNLTAIVWLYRGENKRFAALLEEYRETCREKRREVQTTVPDAIKEAWSLGSAIKGCGTPLSPEFQKLISEMDMECKALDGQILQRDYTKDADALPDLAKTCKAWVHRLREFRRVATPLVADAGQNAETPEAKKELKRQWNQTGESIDTAEAALEANIYFTRHLEWLLHRFPDGTYRDVPGLVKLVTLAEIEAADWSLTPGRYVGVAAAEEDDEENFEEEMRAIHAELGDLNAEAIELAEKIQANFEELGI